MDKQIEELGQDIYDNCPDLCENGCGGKPCYKCIAEALQRDGYRKIPENAVVLTREEAVDLFNSKASGFMTSAIGNIPLNIDGMRKLVDEVSRLLIVQGELQDLNAKYYNEAKDLRRELKQARKETAEKFARKAKEQFADSVRLCEQIDGIAKEFTEGKNGN